MNNVCASIDELKYNLTIDQVYLMYEKCLKKEITTRRSDAITLSNALIYASQSYDRTAANNKQRMWDTYMRSLDWDKLTSKPKKADPKQLAMAFGALGVPVTKPNKGGKV